VTAIVIVVVIVIVVLGAALVLGQRTKRQSSIDQSEQIRSDAAAEAATTVPPAREHAATAQAEAEAQRAEAEAAEARAAQAEAEAEQARLAAQQAEAAHEAQVREADRVDPRVDVKADDYAPQVPDPVDQQPAAAPPAEEVATEPAAPVEPTPPASGQSPLLPRRTPGAQEMPGKPIEQTDAGGGWFTKKAPASDPDQT
jgi:hypothetical protein